MCIGRLLIETRTVRNIESSEHAVVRAKVHSVAFETYSESMLQRSTVDQNAVTAARNNLALEVCLSGRISSHYFGRPSIATYCYKHTFYHETLFERTQPQDRVCVQIASWTLQEEPSGITGACGAASLQGRGGDCRRR